MEMKDIATGLQHIGIPTNDIAETIAFYEKLGFTIALRTENKEAKEQVAFLLLGNLMIETYENRQAAMCSGAVDHIAIDVKDIEAALSFVNERNPFWENGVKYFKIEGPNKEIIEFSQIV